MREQGSVHGRGHVWWRWGHAWQGGCMAGGRGVHGRGACMVGGVHGRGCACHVHPRTLRDTVDQCAGILLECILVQISF